jgi:hypothetical protein
LLSKKRLVQYHTAGKSERVLASLELEASAYGNYHCGQVIGCSLDDPSGYDVNRCSLKHNLRQTC